MTSGIPTNGKPNSAWFKKGNGKFKGKLNSMYGKIPWNKGRPWSEKERRKISISRGGTGITKYEHIYKTLEYYGERIKWKCGNCKISELEHIKLTGMKLAIHHKDRNTYNNEKDNLEILCRSCHAKEHRKIEWRKKNVRH